MKEVLKLQEILGTVIEEHKSDLEDFINLARKDGYSFARGNYDAKLLSDETFISEASWAIECFEVESSSPDELLIAVSNYVRHVQALCVEQAKHPEWGTNGNLSAKARIMGILQCENTKERYD